MEMTDEAQAWTPWPQPVAENSHSSPRQSAMVWLDRLACDILASNEQTTNPQRAFCWISLTVKNPEILVILVSTFYFYSTFCESTKTYHICHQNQTSRKYPQRQGGQMGLWRFRRVKGAVTCHFNPSEKIRDEKCSELKSAFQASILNTFLLSPILPCLILLLPLLRFH